MKAKGYGAGDQAESRRFRNEAVTGLFIVLVSTSAYSATVWPVDRGTVADFTDPHNILKPRHPIQDEYFIIGGRIHIVFGNYVRNWDDVVLEAFNRKRELSIGLSQEIKTAFVGRDVFTHWQQHLRDITIALGFILWGRILYKIKLSENREGRWERALWVVGNCFLVVLFFFSGRYNYIWFDNANDETYVVFVDGRAVELPPQTHTRLYVNCYERQIVIREKYADETEPVHSVRVYSGGNLVWNINQKNRYLLYSTGT